MDQRKVSPGIVELDVILDGGLVRHQNPLLRGPPRAGKTLVCLDFLSEEVDLGEI